ncbi:hypothetical protein F4778DRAFT_441619 [Xylariomycetidae sp. FL2044]|nr:hypothetical protein F4778DRAFT_441619 [Xylariomycetidae sp. FL2044]
MVSLMSHLEILDINLHKVWDKDIRIQPVSPMPNLTHLKLKWRDIHYEDVEAFLTQCPGIRTLDISSLYNPRLTDLEELGEVLRTHGTKLEFLRLNFTCFPAPADLRFEPLHIGSLQRLTNLTELHVTIEDLIGQWKPMFSRDFQLHEFLPMSLRRLRCLNRTVGNMDLVHYSRFDADFSRIGHYDIEMLLRSLMTVDRLSNLEHLRYTGYSRYSNEHSVPPGLPRIKRIGWSRVKGGSRDCQKFKPSPHPYDSWSSENGRARSKENTSFSDVSSSGNSEQGARRPMTDWRPVDLRTRQENLLINSGVALPAGAEFGGPAD